MTKEEWYYLGGWAVFDADSWYNKIAKRNLKIKKPYLVIRYKSNGTMIPKKSFRNFDEALDYCYEQSGKRGEHNLHDFQDKFIEIKDENQLTELVLKAQAQEYSLLEESE